MSHTPGPWRVVGNYSVYTDKGDKRKDNRVAECRRPARYRSEELPNARLIAAAPDLLTACEVMDFHLQANYHDYHGVSTTLLGAWKQIHAAIAKAKEDE